MSEPKDPFDVHPGPLWPPWDKLVVDYDPAWPQEFEAERARIAPLIGPVALAIHHYGSSAVPGMPAKPVIDILVETAPGVLVDEASIERLASAGYVHRRATLDPAVLFLGRGHPRTHHLQFFPRGSELITKRLALRDFLLAHPAEASAYAAVKQKLAAEQSDREYTWQKRVYLDPVVARACAWYAEQGR